MTLKIIIMMIMPVGHVEQSAGSGCNDDDDHDDVHFFQESCVIVAGLW